MIQKGNLEYPAFADRMMSKLITIVKATIIIFIILINLVALVYSFTAFSAVILCM